MMYQTVENTAYCLNCTHQWPVMWDVVEKGPTSVCPKCGWRMGVPEEFVSSGWWSTQETAI
jgi:DNA-directed RNA polymerase subunit RPC12/RpoP